MNEASKLLIADQWVFRIIYLEDKLKAQAALLDALIEWKEYGDGSGPTLASIIERAKALRAQDLPSGPGVDRDDDEPDVPCPPKGDHTGCLLCDGSGWKDILMGTRWRRLPCSGPVVGEQT